MSDTRTEGPFVPAPKKKTILIRIEEWTAWLPQESDTRISGMNMSAGVTGFEMLDNEKLLEVAVATQGQRRFFSIQNPDGKEGELRNTPHGLYFFQAVLASNFDGPPPEGPKSSPNQIPSKDR
jgi:hypothetical protein